jgi:hypothetical protein
VLRNAEGSPDASHGTAAQGRWIYVFNNANGTLNAK